MGYCRYFIEKFSNVRYAHSVSDELEQKLDEFRAEHLAPSWSFRIREVFYEKVKKLAIIRGLVVFRLLVRRVKRVLA
jgi:hypothetical protein